MESNQDKTEGLKPLRVLIADDDPPTRILLRAAITQWGYEPVEAGDGEEAWDILQKPNPPRLLIIDWLMPKLDGLDLCLRIKNELSTHPYTILLTRVEGTANIIKGLEAGADEFLSKPFNMAELKSRLSVGARIVRFEHDLAEKNTQLKNYISCMQELSTLVLDTSQKLYEVLRISESLEQSKKNVNELQTIQNLHHSLEHIIDVIKSFHLDAKA